MGEKTNLVHANKSNSLRVTIPSHIVKQFNLLAGDQIEWDLVPDHNMFKIQIRFLKRV